MKLNFNFQRAAAVASAVGLLAVAGCASSRYERTTGEFMDDKMLTGRVKHALNAQPVYKYPDVRVHTYRGVVQLSGFAANEAQRDAATEIARNARGVTKVENSILLAPLGEEFAHDYVPGRNEASRVRGTNETDRATGAPSRYDRTTTGKDAR